MKKLLLVTALTILTTLSATSVFAQEVPVTYSQSWMTEIGGTPEANKREKRGFSWEGLGKCITGTAGGAVTGGTVGVVAGTAAGRAGGPQATVAGATIGGVGGAIGGALTGASHSCF